MASAPHIEIILDRSGSMAGAVPATIKGFNKFVKDQPKTSRVWLTQFDAHTDGPNLQMTFEGTSVKVARLTTDNYFARGGTPLYDAIGTVVTRMLKDPPKGKTTVLIITDGEENSSTDYDRQKVADLIKKAQKKYDWQFIFMGADIDAYSAGAAIGLRGNQTFAYASVQTGNTWGNMARGTSAYGSGLSVTNTTQDWGGGTSGVEQELVQEPPDLTVTPNLTAPDLTVQDPDAPTSEDTPDYLR